MKFSILSVLFLGLAAAAPAPAGPAAEYDRRQPARRGEPPVAEIMRRNVFNAEAPTATKPVGSSIPTPTGITPTGGAYPSGTAGSSSHTGTAPAPTGLYKPEPTQKLNYNFPAPRIVERAADVGAAVAHWWLQDE